MEKALNLAHIRLNSDERTTSEYDLSGTFFDELIYTGSNLGCLFFVSWVYVQLWRGWRIKRRREKTRRADGREDWIRQLDKDTRKNRIVEVLVSLRVLILHALDLLAGDICRPCGLFSLERLIYDFIYDLSAFASRKHQEIWSECWFRNGECAWLTYRGARAFSFIVKARFNVIEILLNDGLLHVWVMNPCWVFTVDL